MYYPYFFTHLFVVLKFMYYLCIGIDMIYNGKVYYHK